MRRDLIALALLLGVLSSAAPANADSITFASRDITLGACPTPDCAFSVDLLAVDFTDPIIGLLLNFTFNADVLSLVSIVEGAFLQSGQGEFDATPIAGADFQTITKVVNATSPPISGSGILATLTFVPVGTGSDAFTLLMEGLLDGQPLATAYFTEAGGTQTPQLLSGVINVQSPQSVPEPSTLGLLCLGLAAMARRMRRKPQVPASIQTSAH